MYYCFSFAIIAYLMLTQKLKPHENIIGGIGIVLFLLEIILLDSRAGILTFFGIILTYGTYIILKNRINIKTIIIIIFLVIAVIGIYTLRPHDVNRMQMTIEKLGKETFSLSNPDKANVRILIWDAATQVALKNLPLGVGTGDVKDELKKQYETNHYIRAYEENYNAHNQYLQIFATLGIVGFLSFLIILILPFRIGFKNKDILFLVFGIIICINFLVESMLEKQAGIMFFCFFFPLLYYISQQTIKQQ
jgi:O-antigen ligase